MPAAPQEYDSSRRSTASKQNVLDYITANQPCACSDIRKTIPLAEKTVAGIIRKLIREGSIKCLGYAVDAGRDDLRINVQLFGLVSAAMIPRKAVKHVPVPRNYVAKPEPLRERRPKREKYRGEIVRPYVRTFTVLERDPFEHMKLAMVARG